MQGAEDTGREGIGKRAVPVERRRSLALLAALLLACAAGCAAPRPEDSGDERLNAVLSVEEGRTRTVRARESPFLSFLKKRCNDFLDTFSFRLTFGPGLRANAQVTRLLRAGIGKMGPAETGTMGNTFPLYKLGYVKRKGGLWTERSVEIGISLFYYQRSEGELLKGDKTTFGEEDRGFFDIGASLHWLLVGAEAEVRPDEAADFVLGFFGMDIKGDDEPYRNPDILQGVSPEEG